MIIQLKTSPKGAYRAIDVHKGITLEEIYREYREQLPYTILAGRVNNEVKELGYALEEECSVELLDMRTQGIEQIYQRSLSLIYLKAVKDCVGDVKVEIQNSLNKGLYTEIKTDYSLTKEQIREIEERMRELVNADIPLIVEHVPNVNGKEPATLKYYSIDGFRDFFFGQMVPSTGYIRYFELMKYK